MRKNTLKTLQKSFHSYLVKIKENKNFLKVLFHFKKILRPLKYFSFFFLQYIRQQFIHKAKEAVPGPRCSLVSSTYGEHVL